MVIQKLNIICNTIRIHHSQFLRMRLLMISLTFSTTKSFFLIAIKGNFLIIMIVAIPNLSIRLLQLFDNGFQWMHC